MFSTQSSWKPAHDGRGRPEARVLSPARLNLIAAAFIQAGMAGSSQEFLK